MLAALSMLFVATVVVADSSVALTIYFSPTCAHCTEVKEKVLTPLSAAYGERLQLTWVDVSQPQGLKELEAVETRLGTRSNPIPVILYGDQLIANDDTRKVNEALTALLRQRLGEASTLGAGTPAASGSAATPVAAAAAGSGGPTINVAYIEKEGCAACARAAVVLEALEKSNPAMRVTRFNNVRDAELIEAMGEHLRLPEARHLVAPALYIGQDALVDEEITSSRVQEVLDRYAATGSAPFWEQLSAEGGRASILGRFQSMGPWTVVLAAAIDGINPCAFATILFFVSYLAISRRPRRELLLVGFAFTLGVFVTYLAVGLGWMSLLQLASRIKVLARILYAIFALSCFVFAAFSLRDAILARQGRLKDMTMKLPDALRERIKGRIRRASTAFVGVSFVSGLFVSLLELACTGQVYLPTISFVVGIPSMRASALSYLLLYNIIFVTPLIIVLFLATYGVSAVRFQDWFVQNVFKAKLFLAVLFVLLGSLLLTQVF
jgi:cytochrome c biogenesis protein CcdA